MTINVDINRSRLPRLLKLFNSSGKSTRLRLSRHILAHEEIPLDVLLNIFSYVDRETWPHDYFNNLRTRLLVHVDDPALYLEFRSQINSSNDMQKRIVFETLCSVGKRDILPDVIPYMACDTPWIGFPAIDLVRSLATTQDLPLLQSLDMQANSNETMHRHVKELIARLQETADKKIHGNDS